MEELFRIFHVDDKQAAKIKALPDEPHVHDYDELIIGVEGKLEHFIDFENNTLSSPFISFIARGKVHRVIPHGIDENYSIWALRFREDFLPGLTFELTRSFNFSSGFEVPRNAFFKRIISTIEMIHFEMDQPSPHLPVARDLLRALISMISSEQQKQTNVNPLGTNPQNSTYLAFLQILEENFRRDLSVDFYAEKLFMSARNLNLICQSIVQKSVSEIIEERKIAESKKLLTGTDKPISEIGYEIGYNDKSCFTNAFKKKNGITPSAFRKNMQKLLS
jgi:AraC-like DNA-binding protein